MDVGVFPTSRSNRNRVTKGSTRLCSTTSTSAYQAVGHNQATPGGMSGALALITESLEALCGFVMQALKLLVLLIYRERREPVVDVAARKRISIRPCTLRIQEVSKTPKLERCCGMLVVAAQPHAQTTPLYFLAVNTGASSNGKSASAWKKTGCFSTKPRRARGLRSRHVTSHLVIYHRRQTWRHYWDNTSYCSRASWRIGPTV